MLFASEFERPSLIVNGLDFVVSARIDMGLLEEVVSRSWNEPRRSSRFELCRTWSPMLRRLARPEGDVVIHIEEETESCVHNQLLGVVTWCDDMSL